MSVPIAVASLLEKITADKADLAEEVARVTEVPVAEVDQAAAIRTVLLADGAGRMQVVLLANSLLDLDSLNRQLGRELRALPEADVESLRKRIKWYHIPMLPDLTGSAVVDNKVLALSEIYMPSTEEGLYLKIQGKLLEALVGHSAGLDVGIDSASIRLNRIEPSQDLLQIQNAVGNFTKLRICTRLEDTLEMPPLPETARLIIKLRVDSDAGISELSDLVETDPSLSAQVVSWASSSFYAAPGKIRSVHDAIMRVLGFDLVMNLAMGLALGKTLSIPDDSPQGITSYWEQSVWMATLSGAISTAMPKETRPEFGLVYLSGLLHNFGYLVLAHVFPPHFSLTNRYIEVNEQCDPELCEHHLLGITREQIGSQLMYTWNMPEEVVTALRHQKNSSYEDDHAVYSMIIYVATQFLREKNISQGPVKPIPQSIWDAMQITEESAREVFDELMSMADEIRGLAGTLEDAISA